MWRFAIIQFKDKGLLDHIPVLGKVFTLGIENGVYEGAFLEHWLREKLAAKGKHTFKDLIIEDFQDSPRYRYKLQAIAADISRSKLLLLPHDIRDYAIDPDDLDIAHAVRMSMSIPFFFEPVTLPLAGSGADCYVVVAGVLSNFPIHLCDDGTSDPPWPMFGYMLTESPDALGGEVRHEVLGPFSLLASLFVTMMEAHDRMYPANSAFVRTIMIPTLGVKTTDFDLSSQRAEALYQSGLQSGREFFRTWDFEQYKAAFRQVADKNRREMLLVAADNVREDSGERPAV